MQGNSTPDRNNGPLPDNGLIAPFDYDPRTRLIFGRGTVGKLGEHAVALGAQRVLMVTDPGIEEAGHAKRGLESLRSAGLEVAVFDEVRPNPTTEDVDKGLAVARADNFDLIVGLGGGSSMDCAKGINFLLTNGGRMEDYWGVGKATKQMLPMIAVPTTAGTGSEAQSFALIAQAETHIKMACGDKKASCKVAILDPDVTMSMPSQLTAVTGIDALSHALETFVTKPRNPVSMLFSRHAWGLLSHAFPRVLEDPNNREARGAMLLGAHLAGAAIEHSMLGATHALANPLTAQYNLTHGVAIGVMLPHVIRYNAKRVGLHYGQLAADADLCEATDPQAPGLLAERIESLVALSGLPTSLSQCDVDPQSIPQLAADAAEQWTGRFNPRPVDASRFKELYECALSKDSSVT